MSGGIDFKVVIPARYASTRLPGKPLRLIAGISMIEHVYRQALLSGAAEVIIATDDERIGEAARNFGAPVCLTSVDHPSGTDRIAEVAAHYRWSDRTIVVNCQGDEPLVPPVLIRQVAQGLQDNPEAGIATLCTRIHSADEIFDAHIVKVVRDARDYGLYFSRAPIPYHRRSFSRSNGPLPEATGYYRHVGLYAYRVEVLGRYVRLPPCEAERAESLEQLRALHHGIRVHVAEAVEPPAVGVDTEEDLLRVEAMLKDQV